VEAGLIVWVTTEPLIVWVTTEPLIVWVTTEPLIVWVTTEPHERTLLVFHRFFQKRSLKRTAEIDQCGEKKYQN